MLTKILGGTAIILGLYLILVKIILEDQTGSFGPGPSYHIGCFDTTLSKNQTSDIRAKLEELELKENEVGKLNMYNSITLHSKFEKQVKDIAKNFQQYLDEYYRQKIKSQRDLHYYSSLDISRADFQLCYKQASPNQQDCINAWQKYQNSSQQLSELRGVLQSKLDNKTKYQKRIDAYLSDYENEDIDQIEQQYDQKIKNLDHQIFKKQQQIMEENKRKVVINGQQNNNKRDITQHKNTLKQCQENAKIIQYCQGVTKDMKSIKSQITQDQVKERISRKRKIIQAQLIALRKAKKLGDQQKIKQAEKDYNKSLEELKLLQLQITQFNTFEESLCLQCSQESIEQLRKNITNLQTSQSQLIEEQQNINIKIFNINIEIDQINKKKQDLQAELQNTKIIGGMKGCQQQTCQYEQRQFIQSNRKVLNQLKKQIVELQIQFNHLKRENDINIQGMDPYVENTNKIILCLQKKTLYQQLLSNAPDRSNSQGDQKIKQAKTRLMSQLDDFDLEL